MFLRLSRRKCIHEELISTWVRVDMNIKTPPARMSDEANVLRRCVSKLLTGVALQWQHTTKQTPSSRHCDHSHQHSVSTTTRREEREKGEERERDEKGGRQSRTLMHKSKCKRLPLRRTRPLVGCSAVRAAAAQSACGVGSSSRRQKQQSSD